MKKKKQKTNNEIKFESKEIKKSNYTNDDYKMVITFLIVIVIVGCLLALLVYFNGKFVTKDMFQETTTTTTQEPAFNESEITVNRIFDRSEKEYMVLLYDKNDDTQNVLYKNLVNFYTSKNGMLYTVDLSSSMNKKYYNKEGVENTKPATEKDLSITRTTLLTIKNGKVTSYITDAEEITKKLKN